MQLGKLKLKKLVKRLQPKAVIRKAIRIAPLAPLAPKMLGPQVIKKLPRPPFPSLKKKRRVTIMPITPQPAVPMEPVNTVAPLPAPLPSPPSFYSEPSYPSYSEPSYPDEYPEEVPTFEPLPAVAEDTGIETGYMDTAPESIGDETFIESEPDYYEGDFSGLSEAATQQNSTAAQTAQPWYATFLTQALSVYQQEQFRKENAKRARSGLPPLSVDEFKSTLPAAQVEVGMSPQIKQALTWGGIGLAAVILLPQLLRTVRR